MASRLNLSPNVKDLIVLVLTKDVVICQEKLILGIVGKHTEEERDINMRGDRCAAAEVDRNVEGICDGCCAVETSGMTGTP